MDGARFHRASGARVHHASGARFHRASGARFHRARHGKNVPHVQKKTVIFPPVRSAQASLAYNGVVLRRAGYVRPLMLLRMTGKSGHLRTPLANLEQEVWIRTVREIIDRILLSPGRGEGRVRGNAVKDLIASDPANNPLIRPSATFSPLPGGEGTTRNSVKTRR